MKGRQSKGNTGNINNTLKLAPLLAKGAGGLTIFFTKELIQIQIMRF